MDWKAIEQIDSSKYKDMSWKDFPRLEKPRTVNLCPYCRAVVGSVITLPFIFLWRLFPHKKREETHAQVMARSQRNSKIVRFAVAAGFAGFGTYKIIVEGDFYFGAFYLVLAAFNVKSPEIFKWIAKQSMKIKWPKRQSKVKKQKSKRVTPEFFKKLQEKHDLVCPPVYFVDVKEPEELR